MHRGSSQSRELLLVHPGGPLWANKDDGAWSIPKGEYDDGEDPLAVAIRELTEELGRRPINGPTKFLNLGEIVQPGGKQVTAFAVAGDFDPATLTSNLFELEWPPNSGQMQSFPEVDRAQWFAPDEARKKILPGQTPYIDRLLERLGR
jgi:predicted NUDIX family NTP pyrophosphohydrolase